MTIERVGEVRLTVNYPATAKADITGLLDKRSPSSPD
jgi:hypothetical protein